MSGRQCFKKVPSRDFYRESCDEVTKLEAEFRNAYMMKALEAQVAEKEADRVANLAREKLSEKLKSLEIKKLIEMDLKKNSESSKKRETYRQVLEHQILSKNNERKCHEEEARRERKLLEEVDKIMDDEHEMEKKRNHEIMAEKLRRERFIFEEMRCIKRSIEKEREAKASENIRDYIAEVEKRSLAIKKSRDEQQKRRQEVIEKVAKLFVDNKHLKSERDALIADLVAEDLSWEMMIDEEDRKCKAREAKSRLATDLMDQMRLAVESERLYHERDRIFVEEIIAKVMEDERMATLTAEAQRRKQLDHRRDLEFLIEERRKNRDKSLAQLREELREKEEIEVACQERIKEERRRLIAQHAANVAGYMKQGTLSKEEEELFAQSLAKYNHLKFDGKMRNK